MARAPGADRPEHYRTALCQASSTMDGRHRNRAYSSATRSCLEMVGARFDSLADGKITKRQQSADEDMNTLTCRDQNFLAAL